METINNVKIRLERLSIEELDNLKEHVLKRLDEVLEDHTLVMDEITRRSGELNYLDSEIQNSVSAE